MEVYNQSLFLLEDKVALSESDFNEKWNHFKERYPTLYEMLLKDDNMDLSMLKFMCDKLSVNGNTYECQVEIGNKLADKYVFKVVKKPTKEQMKEADKKTKKRFNEL